MRNFKCKYEYTIIRLFQKILSKNRNKNRFLKNFCTNQIGFLQSHSLKKHVKSKRTVYSAQDLREYTLKPEKSYYSLKYYYTIRCNVVHRGKAIHGDEYMLRASLTELLNIFRDVLMIHLNSECIF